MATETEKAYLAGLLDGEGHIGVTLGRQRPSGREWRTHAVIVTVSNTHLETLAWIQREWPKGTLVVRKQPKQTVPIGNLRWSSAAAAEVLRGILPYLRIKAPQAVIALKFAEELANRDRSTRKVTIDEWARREELRLSIRQINRPDPTLKPEPYPDYGDKRACTVCGTEFERHGSSRKYCSSKCENKVNWQKEKARIAARAAASTESQVAQHSD